MDLSCASHRCFGGIKRKGENLDRLSQCCAVPRIRHDPCNSLVPVSESKAPAVRLQPRTFHPSPTFLFRRVRGGVPGGLVDLAKGWYHSVLYVVQLCQRATRHQDRSDESTTRHISLCQ